MLPSGLSMLWESVDPNAALRDRFGFDDFADTAAWVSASLARVWKISVHGCRRMVISGPNAIAWVDSDRGALVIKWSQDASHFDGLSASTQLLSWLGQRDLPIALPVRSADGQDRVVLDGPTGPLSVAVLPELDGDWLDVADSTSVRAAGACLAAVHIALDGYTDPRLWRPSEAEPPDLRVRRWLAEHDHGLVPEASAELTSVVAALPPLEGGSQPVHNDFRAANILTRGGRIVGVLDFDEVAWDHPVSDLAKASVYLATLFRNWQPTPTTARRQLRAGYESVRPLTPLDRRWLDALTRWQAIVAVAHSHDPAAWAEAL